MRLFGVILATVGTALIVVACLQAGASILGDSLDLAAYPAILGSMLLVPGAWLMLREKRH